MFPLHPFFQGLGNYGRGDRKSVRALGDGGQEAQHDQGNAY